MKIFEALVDFADHAFFGFEYEFCYSIQPNQELQKLQITQIWIIGLLLLFNLPNEKKSIHKNK